MQPLAETAGPMSLLFKGKIEEVTLLSTELVKIKEMNGDDEAVMSSIDGANDGTSIANYLARVTTTIDGTPITPAEINKKPLNDIYYLLLKHRILNHGNILEFQQYCTNSDCKNHTSKTDKPFTLEQDLRQFFPKDLIDKINTDIIANAKLGEEPELLVPEKCSAKFYPEKTNLLIERTISSDLKIRFHIKTFGMEKKSLNRDKTNINKNTFLADINIEIWMDGQWKLITAFSPFSSKQMSAMRKAVREADPEFQMIVEYECPLCKTPGIQNAVTIPTFFYPEELI